MSVSRKDEDLLTDIIEQSNLQEKKEPTEKKSASASNTRYSLSWEGETDSKYNAYSRYAVTGKDIMYEAPKQDDSAPVKEVVTENATTTKETVSKTEQQGDPKSQNGVGIKVIVWILCFLPYILLSASLGNLGAIPTMILIGGGFWLARTICNKLD